VYAARLKNSIKKTPHIKYGVFDIGLEFKNIVVCSITVLDVVHQEVRQFALLNVQAPSVRQ
jgi:hypothetical protein